MGPCPAQTKTSPPAPLPGNLWRDVAPTGRRAFYKERNLAMQTPTEDDLRCLNGWPDGSIGHAKETDAICCLLGLCKLLGFGRIPQLANAIEDIWRNPEKVKQYAEQRKAQLKILERNHHADPQRNDL